MAVGASVEDYDHLSGRLHFVLGNMAFDEAQRGPVEVRFKDAFTHYADACKSMLLYNRQRYVSALSTLEKRLRDLPSPRQLDVVCDYLIAYWRDIWRGSQLDTQRHAFIELCRSIKVETH